MATACAASRASYDLPLPADGRAAPGEAKQAAAAHLPDSLLVRNMLWFCRLRWLVIGLLALFGALGLCPSLLSRFGLRPHPVWPFIAAGVLTAANLLFLAHARALVGREPPRGAKRNLWAQIVVDLSVLTVVVHYVGSLETYAAFAYLFHIVLACIFFPRRWSSAVTALACVLYVGCVALEESGALPTAGIYMDASLREQMDRVPGVRLLNVGSALLTWAVVAHLASHLSAMVRERDQELAETNRRLVQAQRERTRHMLHTTHELKAPFSAIHANVQLLLGGYCGELPDAARDVLDRIAARCQRLAAEIQEMLQLANLQSEAQEPPRTEVDLADILGWCVERMQPVAKGRGITIDADLRPARLAAVEDHMKMLLVNLLANAVNYSADGGRVRVLCSPAADGPRVVIADEGIGIPPDKLPHIFQDYYRTNEAVRHNKESTGLGLAIVRHVAEMHSVRVRVESAPSLGTTFTLSFPADGASAAAAGDGKETEHGLSDDRGRR